MRCLWIGTRSTTVLLSENELYFTEPKIALTLNGAPAGEAETAVISLFGLAPATRYALTASREGKEPETLAFTTAAESGALDVCAFGAKGDGETDDTAACRPRSSAPGARMRGGAAGTYHPALSSSKAVVAGNRRGRDARFEHVPGRRTPFWPP
jgi:hypothetical protein